MASYIDAAKATLSENLGGIAQKLAPSGTQFSLHDVPDQSEKVAVVSGGSRGIGFGVTHSLLAKNIQQVFVVSESEEAATKARETIRKDLGDDKASRMTWIQADLGDWTKLPGVAEQIQHSTDRLDILVGNAGRGIMTAQLTEYGIDRHMAVNHFGHVILTSHLLPLLKTTATNGHTVRISMQSSNLHESVPKDTKFASVEEINNDLGPSAQYGRAKLANLLYAKYLARHLSKEHPQILANATHPGVVSTDMSKKDIHEPYPIAGYGMSAAMEPFKKDQFDGALPTLFAVTTIDTSGSYICPPAAFEDGSELARDEQLAENLMQFTHEVIKDKTGEDLKFF